MWQRLQTLYLAIALVLVGVMFFAVKAVVPGADGEVAERIRYVAYVPYLILLILIALLDLLALTTWKFRMFQMRTAVLAAILTAALQIWLAVDIISCWGSVSFRITALFPLVALVLDFLAARAILADEMLVQSAYHLRSSKRRKK